MMRIRWSDNDRYFGPFAYARTHRPGYRPFAIMLGSGDSDDYPGCRLRLSAFGHTLIVALPPIIRPWKEWVDTSRYEWSRGPGSGYWDSHEREYGFTYSEGHFSLHYGRQTDDSSTAQRKGWFVPWRSWRHVRRSFYGLYGEHIASLPERRYKDVPLEDRHLIWEAERQIEVSCPTVAFRFVDFDGEKLVATTRIEEREWRLGEGKFRWLSLFARARVERSLCIEFSGETGRRKGSWKGGTVGHSIKMLPGELHEAAFRRYCTENEMTFTLPCDSGRQPQAENAEGG